jgi:hypothetical protein
VDVPVEDAVLVSVVVADVLTEVDEETVIVEVAVDVSELLSDVDAVDTWVDEMVEVCVELGVVSLHP